MDSSRDAIQVFSSKNTGSAIAEAFLTLAGIPFVRIEVDYESKEEVERLIAPHNPLGEFPTLLLPDGQVLTETLAIAHYVETRSSAAKLIPESSVPFLRWSTFLISSIYPTFTYGDEPRDWVADEKGALQLRDSTEKQRQFLWRQIEAVAGAPYFLGSEFSAIDIYLCVMTYWRPRRDWFRAQCPKLHAIAVKLDGDPRLAEVWKHHFGE
jgi:GST-like protein